jgi:hypothetical protein
MGAPTPAGIRFRASVDGAPSRSRTRPGRRRPNGRRASDEGANRSYAGAGAPAGVPFPCGDRDALPPNAIRLPTRSESDRWQKGWPPMAQSSTGPSHRPTTQRAIALPARPNQCRCVSGAARAGSTRSRNRAAACSWPEARRCQEIAHLGMVRLTVKRIKFVGTSDLRPAAALAAVRSVNALPSRNEVTGRR